MRLTSECAVDSIVNSLLLQEILVEEEARNAIRNLMVKDNKERA